MNIIIIVCVIIIAFVVFYQIYENLSFNVQNENSISSINMSNEPMYYYKYTRYKLPYRYPFNFNTITPFPHKRYNGTYLSNHL